MSIKYLDYIAKGLIVGGSMLTPGVSGGTMAIALGVYDDLIAAVSSAIDRKFKNLLFLLLFAFGGSIGMLVFARPILYLKETFEFPMMYFFIGAVAGGIPLIFRKAKQEKFTLDSILYPALGVFLLYLVSLIPENLFTADPNGGVLSYLLLIAAGLTVAVALILPGISVSHMLLLLGIYNITMGAIKGIQFGYLIPLALGVVLGVVLTTKILEKAMNNHPRPTYLIIFGFVIASVAEVFPGIPTGMEILICPILFLMGFLIIKKLSTLEY